MSETVPRAETPSPRYRLANRQGGVSAVGEAVATVAKALPYCEGFIGDAPAEKWQGTRSRRRFRGGGGARRVFGGAAAGGGAGVVGFFVGVGFVMFGCVERYGVRDGDAFGEGD